MATMDRKSILITGINGFVGTNLYHSMNSKIKIHGIDITTDNIKQNCTIYTWSDFSTLPKVDAIIHLAGLAHDTSNTTDLSKYNEINVGLTKRIFDYFLKSSARKFIFFSSVKAVADSVEGSILTELTKPNPKTPYGKSKLAAENYILSHCLPYNKKVYILRPAMIHGFGNKGNLNLLFSMVQRGIPYPLGRYDNSRSFTSIKNLLFIVEQFISREIKSGIYNICDDEPLSTVKIVEMIYDVLGTKPKILNLPKSLVQTLAAAGDFLRLPLNSERLKKMTESYIVSNSEVKKTLMIKALPILARDGMRLTINSFSGK